MKAQSEECERERSQVRETNGGARGAKAQYAKGSYGRGRVPEDGAPGTAGQPEDQTI